MLEPSCSLWSVFGRLFWLLVLATEDVSVFVDIDEDVDGGVEGVDDVEDVNAVVPAGTS